MRSRTKLFLISLPMLAGIAGNVLVGWLVRPELVLAFRAGLGVLLLSAGLVVTLLLAAAAWGSWRRDRVARGQLETAREEYEAARSRFLRSLDHELKNPIAGLQIELANVREARSPVERETAEANAGRALARLVRLLADLRKLADLESRPIERSPVDVPSLVDEMIEAARSLPQYAGREVHLTIPRVPQLLQPVIGDRDLLGLLFYNLIENALKFTDREDAVEVRVREDGRSLLVEVADAGPGIPPGEEVQIFEELYRGAGVKHVEGSGLGLALVRRIAALHSGEVNVRSRREPPRNTVFTVRLPVTKL